MKVSVFVFCAVMSHEAEARLNDIYSSCTCTYLFVAYAATLPVAQLT
jgi:hypothetical protein